MTRSGLIIFGLLLVGSTSQACSVPVFRYALERWAPSSYDLIVFHRGRLSDSDRAAVAAIQVAGRTANLRVIEAELAGDLDPALRTVWDREGKGASLPHALLRYPESRAEMPSLWAGRLTPDALRPWLDSPARQALFTRLTAGHAGVVVLLLSGDRVADEAARALLRRELPRIASRIELPPKTDDGPQVRSELPLRIDFPVVEVARQPAEAALVRLLLASEDGLERVRGPIAFPVFGRGRALCSLHGNDLEGGAGLRNALEFLCRACSCQVKELNPGVDLLLSGNWDVIFDAERGPRPREVAPTVRVADHRGATTTTFAAELRAGPPAGYDAAEAASDSAAVVRFSWLRYATPAAVLLVLVTGFWAMRGRRPVTAPQ